MKILIISRYFSPLQNSRALQITKLAQALSAHGNEVFVVTGTHSNDLVKNNNVDSSKFLRVRYFFAGSETGRLKNISRLLARIKLEMDQISPVSTWIRNTTTEISNVVNEFVPDVVVTSSTPFESHFLGGVISSQFGIPWIASFSDPWPASLLPTPYNRSSVPLISLLQMATLKRILRKCNALHLTNAFALDLLEENTGCHLKSKSYVIPHIGYTAVGECDNSAKGYLVHLGRLTKERVSGSLLDALKLARAKLGDSFNGLLQVGFVCPEFKKMVVAKKVGDLVTFHDSVSYERAESLAASAQCLLIIEADMEMSPFLPSKFADYVSSGQPYISISPEKSPIKDYLSKYGGGCVVQNKTHAISSAIVTAFTDKGAACMASQALQDCFNGNNVSLSYMSMFNDLAGDCE